MDHEEFTGAKDFEEDRKVNQFFFADKCEDISNLPHITNDHMLLDVVLMWLSVVQNQPQINLKDRANNVWSSQLRVE